MPKGKRQELCRAMREVEKESKRVRDRERVRKLAQKVVKIYQVKFENENVAGSHFIAEAHQICMLSKHSEWATREAAASMGE